VHAPSSQITLSGAFGTTQEVIVPSFTLHLAAGGAREAAVASGKLGHRALPKHHKLQQQEQQPQRIKKRHGHGLRQIASLCHVLSEFSEGSSISLITPSAGTMRRRVTLSCVAELPEGLAPTKRCLGLLQGGAEDFVREVACTEEIPQHERETARMQKPCSEKRGSSTDTACTEAPTSDTTSAPESDPAHERFASEAESARDSSEYDSEERRLSTCSSSQSEKAQSQEDRKELEETIEQGIMEETGSFEERFDVMGKLGEGAYGIVYACAHRTGGLECAMKLVRKDRLLPRDLTNLLGEDGEIRLQSSLPRHHNILGLLAFFDQPQEVRLIMDLCRGGDLFDAIAEARRDNQAKGLDVALSETASCNVTRQLFSALAFCHQHGVVHRDVKAENVLLTHSVQQVSLESAQAQIKLCDFGLAARYWPASSKLRVPVGSPDYVAPEVARKQPYGSAVDIWSSAVVLFASLRGRLPFAAKTDHDVLLRVREGRPTFDSGWKQISSQAREAILHLMKLHPSERPTAEEALHHPWFVTRAEYLQEELVAPPAAIGG
jgi:hypothetical protein